MMNTNKTKKFYNKNSESYILKTKDIILYKQIERFLWFIDKNEKILDLGCGSGNNLKEFIIQGYKAIGIDYSKKLVDFAKIHSKTNVFCLDFSNIANINKLIKNHNVQHIFASSSLLHLTKKQLANFFSQIEFNGIMFFSLKEGLGKSLDEKGRFFAYYKKEEVEKILSKKFVILKFIISDDILGRNRKWLSWIVKLKK